MDLDQVPFRRLGRRRRRRARWGLVALLWLGLALRLALLLENPLHQDEALYGYWGRLISSGRDPWLATAPVDKPPLALYLIAGGQAAFGVSEFALRLPGLAASLLSISLVYALARRLYGDPAVGLVAAAVLALTPYPLCFGATALTDPLFVAGWLAACVAAVRGRWGWAGVLSGLALATKQQALLLLPLTLGLGLCRRLEIAHLHSLALAGSARGAQAQVSSQKNAPRNDKFGIIGAGARAMGRALLGLGGVVALICAWDALRIVNGAGAGFWAQGVDSYGGLRLIWPAELASRGRGWLRLGGYLLGWPGGSVLWVGSVVALLAWDVTRWRRTWPALVDLLFLAWVALYLFFHFLVAFPVWDRYLLPLVPALGVLLGRAVRCALCAARRVGPWARWGVALSVVVCLGGGGVLAAGGRVPVGGDHGAYDGLPQVIAYLRALPVGTVLYDRWLSWHYDFYLYDAYLYRAGFSTPGWLAADAAAHDDGRPRYLVVPDWQPSARLGRALEQVGLAMAPVLETRRRDGTTSFIVYEIGR